MKFKNIHIGEEIRLKVVEYNIDASRIAIYLKCGMDEIENFYKCQDMNTTDLMRWSKLLRYDFFRLYSQHIILYAPKSKNITLEKNTITFKKNIYTKDLIDFILEVIENGIKTRQQVIDEYKIPKTTLYKWISKYKK
ncbi:transposase [Chryseobacterium viscerum]|uniref:Transposase n=1 Tax=Chryseobacterium viscerum TaxID=1037377 RepID=A0A316WAJ1_9FLAO|nr:transposase [Chryseobacterium viscerum]PWN57919.1 transposase [Chryseobacterium viscerum]